MKKSVIIGCVFALIMSQGKIGGVTYFDISSTDDSTSFTFQRQYFGYSLDASENVKFKVLFDVGRTDKIDGEDTRLVAFLKKAQIDYTSSWGTTSMGLIGMNTYGVQEKNWGYRFIEKSAIDKNNYTSTADIGFGFSRNLIEDLNLNLQVVNGEGYKEPQGDKYHKIAINTTYGERNLKERDGFNVGAVYTTEQTDDDPNTMTSIFGGFASMGLRFGVDYSINSNDGINRTLISATANYSISENLDGFLRYDMNDPGDDTESDGDNYLISGVVFSCGSGLLVAPNIRITSYEEDVKENVTEYKINFQFKF